MTLEKQDNSSKQDAPGTEPSAEDEFDAAFAEFDAEDTPADKVAVESEGEDDDDSAADDNAPASDDDAAASQQPAAGDEPTPGSDQSQDDPWANAPAELRERREAELRDNDLRIRSANGRVAAKDRQIAELQRQLEEAQKAGQKPEATQQSDGNQGGGDGGDKAKGALSQEALAQLREDYPDLAGPLIDMLEAQAQQLEKVSKGVGTFEQAQQAQAIAEQEGLLTQQHPDWEAAAADDRFGGWLESQPQSIKDAMARNFDKIVDGNDAALVIDKFKRDVGFQAPSQNPQNAGGVDPKRERQLQGGRDTGRTGPSSRTGLAKDDFDGAVNAFLQD